MIFWLRPTKYILLFLQFPYHFSYTKKWNLTQNTLEATVKKTPTTTKKDEENAFLSSIIKFDNSCHHISIVRQQQWKALSARIFVFLIRIEWHFWDELLTFHSALTGGRKVILSLLFVVKFLFLTEICEKVGGVVQVCLGFFHKDDKFEWE